MPERELPARSVRTSFWLAAWFVLIFGLRGQADVSVGLAIGSALSIFSLWSLAWAVPRATETGARRGPWLLAALFMIKLPLYGVILNYALMSRSVHPGALFAGVAVVPVVIVLKTLSRLLMKLPAP
ncbi:MAG: ATP synthase subunit I [Chthonomonadales bacterium]|nr:ATP synthase subunit I [Chthonomonadales bacterium]